MAIKMVTRCCVLFLLPAVVGCGARVDDAAGPRGDRATAPPALGVVDGPVAPAVGPSPAGASFVVHEWGTNTIVVGSDGSLQPGLEHEEEGLPAFVHDRIRAAVADREASVLHMDCTSKLETPITYFYSDTPRTVRVAVDFPTGVFTQWYPRVDLFYPLVAQPCGEYYGPAESNTNAVADPYLDPAFPFRGEACREKFQAAGGGLLDWGEVEILPRDQEAIVPVAPLAESTWSHARQVRANSVRVPGADAQAERFLFYRGLGSFEPPVVVATGPERAVTLSNRAAVGSVGVVFALTVDESGGAFVAHDAGILPGGTLAAHAPAPADLLPMDDYVASLSAAMVEALVGTGLYTDEAEGMVATWSRQWFRTPGQRVLYLMPQRWTDEMIPLRVEPAPDAVVRTVVIRVETITPELEAEDVAKARDLDGASSASAERHFLELGRFAEPRLRRALALLGQPAYGAPLLARISTVGMTAAVGE